VSYRRTLVTQWSTRDRLAVLGIAVTTAAVVGSVLLLSAVAAQATAVAQDAGGNATVTLQDASEPVDAAGRDAVVYPVAVAQTSGGRTVRVVGVPNRSDAGPRVDGRDLTGLTGGPPPRGGVRVPTAAARGPGETVRLEGTDGRRDLTVQFTRDGGREMLFPPEWYVADRTAVERLGVSTVLVVRGGGADAGGAGDATGRQSPLVTGLAFLEAGTGQLLGALWVVVLAAAVLTGVVAFSVTRMSVRDRVETIHVVRATGASPRTVLATVALRALLLTGTGVLTGYALGTVGTRATVVVAAYLGVPTTLDPRMTPVVAGRLLPALVGVLAAGTVAATGAALRAVRSPPAALLDSDRREREHGVRRSLSPGAVVPGGRLDGLRSGLPEWVARGGETVRAALRPRTLDRRAAAPTAATLGVFVVVALVVAAVGATLAPLGADAGTVVQPGASHPLTSRVDVGQATALRSRGAVASPEVLVPAVVDGEPLLARGANFSAFAAVTDASLVSGRTPAATDEAVVGAGVARRHGLSVGDRVALGGPSGPHVAVVEVVGTYRAPGVDGAGVVMPLATARHLTDVGRGEANVIRVDRPPGALSGTGEGGDRSAAESVVVTDLAVPERLRAGEDLVVTVTVENLRASAASRSVTVTAGDRQRTERLTVAGGARERVEVRFPTGEPDAGTLTVTAGDVERRTTVGGETLRLGPLPSVAPPDGRLRVRVTDAGDRPVTNATVTAGDATARTAGSGVATVRLSSAGRVNVTVRREAASTSRTVEVRPGATRLPTASVRVTPSAPTVVTRPTARVVVRNPWSRPLERRVRVTGPGRPTVRAVSLEPGGTTTLSVPLGRAPVGAHEVAVRVDGRRVAVTSYRVQGDRRAVAAAASSGRYVAGSDLGRGVTSLLGNVELLLGAMLALAALATVGTATASFAAAVHARRETVGVRRATGADPRTVLRLVLGDAARVCCVAVPPALLGGYAAVELLGALGLLTAFGVTLVPSGVVPVLLLAGLAAVGLALVGAALATLPALRAPPAALLDGTDRGQTESGTDGSAGLHVPAAGRGTDGADADDPGSS